MKYWIGRWLIALSAIHILYGFVAYHSVLSSILRRGVFNTAGNEPTTDVAFWFFLFGMALFICGLGLSSLERASRNGLPVSLGWSLLALSVVAVILMPASGFWLVFPPALAILLRRPRIPRPADA